MKHDDDVKFLALSRPNFTLEDAERIARELYGLNAMGKEFYAERDRSFYLRADDAREFVLKIVHPDEHDSAITFQIEALNCIAKQDPGLPIPRVQHTRDGAQIAHQSSKDGRSHIVWMLSYLPGTPVMETEIAPKAVREVGRLAGRMDRALRGFFHPAAGREVVWDARMAPRLVSHLALIEDKADRALLKRIIADFTADILPRLEGQRSQVIHNDLNLHNVLVDDAQPDRIAGVIDFGDMVHGPLIMELSVAASDIVLADDLLERVQELLRGYHEIVPLTAGETELLYDLIQTRHAMSLAILARRRAQNMTEANYLESYAEPCRKAAWALDEIGRERACAAFRAAIEPARSVQVKRIPESEVEADRSALLARRRRVMGPQTYLFYDKPLHMVRGEGAWLYDMTGRRYLDVYNNVPHVGHCHPHVVEAIARQAAILNTNTRYLCDDVLDYAERLGTTMPTDSDLTACMFVNSGSEAVDLAVRLAKAFTGASGALVMEYAYHGWTESVEALSPEFRPADQLKPHVRTLIGPDDYRGPYRRGGNDIAALYAADANRAIQALAGGGHKPALLIADAGLLTNGVLDAPMGWLQGVYERVRKAGGVCIADEVQTGFGRQGDAMWGFQPHGVTPDIVCLGKPIGNGHPLGAVVTRPEIVQALIDQHVFFSTFGGNNVSCAAGMAVLDVLERERLQENARSVGAHFKQALRKLADKHDLIGDVRGRGLLIGLELVRDRKTLEPAAAEAKRVVNRMRDLGVLTATEGPHGNVLKLRPPICFTREQADMTVDAIDRALSEL
ncbi:aminotransferase class III-fold pyridoxal phosphate-dependent enzyme [Dongia deserti]|uniref:aminotransferase class III-fold pyridoxal phosphate-dependent enzyme n=1 Tax=Dongia deserti TaxID=2268030 RepID=UPI000E64A592|nr:aminotransferase class III-fold pyridoxal phosphate-dependent enzyme [Dongia deserti]